jgi:PAS domain S-box-containing protein
MPTILAIDDMEDNLLVVSALLKNMVPGCRVATAMSGSQGIEKAKTEKPDTILLDIHMPGMDGFEVCRILKINPETKHIPVIMLTAVSTGSDSRVKGLEIGADAFLTKPVDRLELTAQVKAMLRIKHAEDILRNESEILEQLVSKRTTELVKQKDKLISEIHERKWAEEALRESEKKYRNLFENLHDVYYRTDDKGIITLISPSVEQHFGYTPDELIGQNIKNFYVNPKRREELLTLLVKDGYVNNFEAPLKRKDNTALWVSTSAKLITDETGDFIGVEGLTRDILEQKEMESDIQALVESTVGITGPDFFKIIVKKLCEWLNCECAILGELVDDSTIQAIAMEVDGKPVDGYSYKLAGAPCNEVIENGFCAYPEGVCDLFPEDGDLAEMNAVGYIGTPLVDSKRKPIGILCAISLSKLTVPKRAEEVINIIAARVSAEIERKRLEKEQKKLEKYFQQTQRLDSIGTLAGGIAHDFNNILFPLMGYTEMLRDNMPSNSPSQAHLDQIYGAALRAKDLVKQILTFSRQGNQEMKPMKLQPIVKEALKLLRSSIPSTIDIQQDIDSGCGVVVSDPTQVHQIVMNLATNAYHAMENTGGRLNVMLKQLRLKSDQSLLPELIPGEYALLTVADTGTGIDKDIIDRIFDPYYTTKETGKGTGLGLSVVQGIVKSCGGNIRIDSEPGKGTEIHVYLPIESQKKVVMQTDRSGPISQGTEKILLVDDEAVIVEMMQQMLERLGYKVTTRNGSIDALEAFKANPDAYDLILTDMTMPNMTGVQLAREIKNIRPKIPIIICTGFSDHLNEEKANALGIQGFIMKPVIMRELSEIIRNVLDDTKEG